MIEESVESSVDVAEPIAEKYDVESFNVQDYTGYFPTEYSEHLIALLESRSYGWKQAARLLNRIKESDQYTAGLKENLVDMCEGKPRTRDPMKDARSGLRRVLVGLTEDKLKELCISRSVSYNSFMVGNDRQGLVEALIDELLVNV